MKHQLKEQYGEFIYCIATDETDNLFLVNYNILESQTTKNTVIYTKEYKKYLEFEKIDYYNEFAIEFLKQCNWNRTKVYSIYEGTPVILHNLNDKWILTTEKKINGTNKIYKKSICELFLDTLNIETLDEIDSCPILKNNFNKDYVYYFDLIHHKNNLIVHHSHYGCGYKELIIRKIEKRSESTNIFDMGEEKRKLKTKIPNVNVNSELHFSCADELIAKINNISYENMCNKRITHEGFKVYVNNCVCKIETNIYQQVKNIRPINPNIHQGYLELYQQNKLKEYLPYFTKYYSDVIHRLNSSLKTLSKELLNLYHLTRRRREKQIYDHLPETYCRLLYEIHGVYIDARKNDFVDGEEIDILDTKNISVHEIYHYLKSLHFSVLKQLYFDRETFLEKFKNAGIEKPITEIEKEIRSCFIEMCMFTKLQSKLMYE